MSSLAVDLGALEGLVSRMAAFEEQLDALDADVGRRVAELHAGWHGSAAAAHRETEQRWSAGAAEMREALAELRAIADSAHANYRSAVRANVSLWAS